MADSACAFMLCCCFLEVFYLFLVFKCCEPATSILALGNNSHPCSSTTSSLGVFKCVQGSECVYKEYVCDGTKDCRDGSDEESCSTRKKRQSGSCMLPLYPEHGSYEVLDDPLSSTRRPGELLRTFALKISCNQGFGMSETDSDLDTVSTQVVICSNGRWSQNMPNCVRFCQLERDPSIHYMCPGGSICKKFVSPETLVKPYCNSPIYYSVDNHPYMKCLAGSWNYIAKCKPDCGRINPDGVQLLIDGTSAKRGELPWHVGVYRKTKPYMQICGGSLVSNNVVISAAHCFWSGTGKLLSASFFAVAVGKLYRPWDDPRDVDAQKSDVKHIAIPKLFRGSAANFQEDIGVLTLTAPFSYETYIRPVCLSFDDSFDRWHLQQNNIGKVAGWGLTGANGVASDILKVVGMPFINEATCINTLPQSFTAYITGDKFCAGYTNGTALCKGDSGGGIVFADREQGVNRYYLRGIASTAPTSADKLCNDMSYITFTRIAKHESIVQNALAVALLDRCPTNMFHCADGTCRDHETKCGQKQEYLNRYETEPVIQAASTPMPSDSNIYFGDPAVYGRKKGDVARRKCEEYSQRYQSFCRSPETINNQNNLTETRKANRGEFTHLALLGFRSDTDSPKWMSNGCIISEKFILTPYYYIRINGAAEYVAVGVYTFTDQPREGKIYKLKERIRKSDTSSDLSLALLETETEIIFDNTVLPICLDTGSAETSRGIIADWVGSKVERTIHVASMTEQSESTCKKTYGVSRRLPSGYNHTTSMCYNSTVIVQKPCVKDVGGPLLAVDNNCLYTAIGIESFGKGSCAIYFPDLLIRVSHFVSWIENIVW